MVKTHTRIRIDSRIPERNIFLLCKGCYCIPERQMPHVWSSLMMATCSFCQILCYASQQRSVY